MLPFAEALNEAMNRASLSQSEVTRRTSLSQPTINGFANERRLPNFPSFLRLCVVMPDLLLWFVATVYGIRTGAIEPPEDVVVK